MRKKGVLWKLRVPETKKETTLSERMVFVDAFSGECIGKYYPKGQYWSISLPSRTGMKRVGILTVLNLIPPCREWKNDEYRIVSIIDDFFWLFFPMFPWQEYKRPCSDCSGLRSQLVPKANHNGFSTSSFSSRSIWWRCMCDSSQSKLTHATKWAFIQTENKPTNKRHPDMTEE